MLTPLLALQAPLAAFTAYYIGAWFTGARAAQSASDVPAEARDGATPSAGQFGLGLVTNFFDTLGIGSFAPTTAVFKFFKLVPDRLIPGTLNVGHTLPTITQAFIYTAAIDVDQMTLVLMILAAVSGAWLGASVVSSWPKRTIQAGMGGALLVAAALFAWRNMGGGGTEAGPRGVPAARPPASFPLRPEPIPRNLLKRTAASSRCLPILFLPKGRRLSKKSPSVLPSWR